ncbi:MAG: enoyl-CoA hydratase/isomerase family protein [Legionellaceae bacterium]|nr:enoyl-CoA hydratase/isomerase family protein [Legionellaceae bacterium]
MQDFLEIHEHGAVLQIVLNRPDALHALNLEMIEGLYAALQSAEKNPKIQALLIQASPARAFCAGGDVRWAYHTGLRRDPAIQTFFDQEYTLNHAIYCFPKPYIVLMDGATIGGGAGISIHGSYPIATERFSFSMPETGIGLFPDVGMSYWLSRLPGAMGIYLALTGARLDADQALALGLVRAILPSAQIPAFVQHLLQANWSHQIPQLVVDAALYMDASTKAYVFPEWLNVVDRCFHAPTVEAIVEALARETGDWAATTCAELMKKSPLSLKVTLEQIRRAQHMTFAECIAMDRVLLRHFIHDLDFYEGVRALLIDKDKSPRWQPASLAEITDAQVMSYFMD